MRLCKSAWVLRWVMSGEKIIHGSRRFASLSSNPLIDDSDNLVVVEGKASSRTAILNRPSSLNALNTSMVSRLHKLYKNWEEDPSVGFVAVKGGGRAFSAGGDIVALYNMIKEGNLEECKQFFWTIYSFIYFLGTYIKPHVALLNGITMGGGAGISIPGTFRVATDKTIFATPETLIGFHPDAGASVHLSHLPGYMCDYLALAREKLNGAEMLSCGLATHFSPFTVLPTDHFLYLLQLHACFSITCCTSHFAISSYHFLRKLPLVEEQLGKVITDDPCVIENSLGNQEDVVLPDQTVLFTGLKHLTNVSAMTQLKKLLKVWKWRPLEQKMHGAFQL